MIQGFSRYYDDEGDMTLVMCPLCFHLNEPVPARAGGMLSTVNGDAFDVCVNCSAKEYLWYANVMGA